MSYICPYCGGRHRNPDTGRRCAETAARRTQRAGAALGRAPEDALRLPSGHYLVTLTDTDNQPILVHIVVRCIHGTRWDGRYVVNVVDSVTEQEVPVPLPDDREFLIREIRAAGFRGALRRYGRETDLCPICNQKMDSAEVRTGVHRNAICFNEVNA